MKNSSEFNVIGEAIVVVPRYCDGWASSNEMKTSAGGRFPFREVPSQTHTRRLSNAPSNSSSLGASTRSSMAFETECSEKIENDRDEPEHLRSPSNNSRIKLSPVLTRPNLCSFDINSLNFTMRSFMLSAPRVVIVSLVQTNNEKRKWHALE